MAFSGQRDLIDPCGAIVIKGLMDSPGFLRRAQGVILKSEYLHRAFLI